MKPTNLFDAVRKYGGLRVQKGTYLGTSSLSIDCNMQKSTYYMGLFTWIHIWVFLPLSLVLVAGWPETHRNPVTCNANHC